MAAGGARAAAGDAGDRARFTACRRRNGRAYGGFRRGLSEAGFVEGRNVAIEYRWAEGQYDRLPALAADLVGRKVAVILAGGGDTPRVRQSRRTRPFRSSSLPRPIPSMLGLVASLNRPGGNATGVTLISSELGPKRLGVAA